MPPRRTANADTPDPARVLPTNSEEMADLIRMHVGTNILITGITLPPGALPNPARGYLQTMQHALQFSTSQGQPAAGMTPEFVLAQRPSQDFSRLTQAITNQAARGRFR